MKLKDRPLEWWKGKRFTYWCRADQNDTRKINYTVNHRSIGKGLEVFTFTSDDRVSFERMYDLKEGIIHELRQSNGEWFVTIDSGIIPTELLKELKNQ